MTFRNVTSASQTRIPGILYRQGKKRRKLTESQYHQLRRNEVAATNPVGSALK